jgi:hypothetical protein
MKSVSIIFIISFSFLTLFSQVPNIQWQKSLGGSDVDKAYSICKTFDNCFVVVGGAESVNGNVTGHVPQTPGFPENDLWLIKLDSNGNLLWNKCLGGFSAEIGYSISQTLDSGFIISGYTNSHDGDVTGLHGVRDDYWVVKTNSIGNIQWQKCLGGTETDISTKIIQTNDSGYFLVGKTGSFDGDIPFPGIHGHSGYDIWAVKLNANGTKQWSRCYGGSNWEDLSTCIQTSDGGYMIAGQTDSYDGDVSGQHNSATSDVWLVKIDSQGVIQWQKCYGGTDLESPSQIIPSNDGGYFIAAESSSTDGDVSNSFGQNDFWLFKIDSLGTILWSQCYGNSHFEELLAACGTSEGGVVMAGTTNVDGGMVTGTHGYLDYWVVNVDSLGNVNWTKALGGSDLDKAYSVVEAPDGGFVIAGYSLSTNGDVTSNHGLEDYWIVKLAPLGLSVKEVENEIMDLKVFQNDDQFTLKYFSKKNLKVELNLFNINGKIIFSNILYANEGINHYNINVKNFAKGIYFLQLDSIRIKFFIN